MKLGFFGRMAMALFATLVLGIGMTACGGGTVGYIWVLGQQYNQVGGFKVDDYTGNLTQVVGSPFSSNGTNPVSLVIKPGGRYVFVINQGTVGTCATCGNASQTGAGASIAVYAVGGDGVLTFQETYEPQGYIPVWAQFDPTGSYLYVLTQYSPGYNATTGLWTAPNTDGNGAITVFSVDSNTGRLSLVTNSQTQKNNVNTPFFEVGPSPLMMKVTGGCVFTVNSANQTITPLAISGSQLAFVTTGTFSPGTQQISSINSNGSYMVLTDYVANNVLMYTVGGSCNLTAVNGGGVTSNVLQGTKPVWSLIDSTGKYLYVLDQASLTSLPGTPASAISAWSINTTTSQLQQITGAPYTVGSGPVCMVEDTSNQYMYVSNHNDGTVTGKVIDPATGILSNLSRGATFPAVGNAECLVLSGVVE
jgi:6-phosphogluconolactonase (cycloisomerase 2 family)